MVYKLMKNKIKKSDLENAEVVEKLQEQLDVFYAGDKLTTAQYNELVAMLPTIEEE